MYSSARSSPSSRGSGTLPVIGTVWPGFVPHVTCGASAAASMRSSASKRAPSSERIRRPALHVVGERALHARAGPRGRRTSSRRERSARPARPTRSTCSRSSCGPPSRARGSPRPRTRRRSPSHPADGLLRDQPEDQVLRAHAAPGQPVEDHAHRPPRASAPASAWPGRARPRSCRCRTRARRTRRASRCANRRTRSSCPAASARARGRSRARSPGARGRARRTARRTPPRSP